MCLGAEVQIPDMDGVWDHSFITRLRERHTCIYLSRCDTKAPTRYVTRCLAKAEGNISRQGFPDMSVTVRYICNVFK